ncbi:hypothetical protein MKZ38_007507 [Zalerion maritima]|uniref:Uncharacterized protein n=1 Tax=Zalerion maritima TaxID=339359 RepID=A0AAD5WMX0_9PEZI|nr:hypothetical protein MKZ38_007507 [Zalerion maritima]
MFTKTTSAARTMGAFCITTPARWTLGTINQGQKLVTSTVDGLIVQPTKTTLDYGISGLSKGHNMVTGLLVACKDGVKLKVVSTTTKRQDSEPGRIVAEVEEEDEDEDDQDADTDESSDDDDDELKALALRDFETIYDDDDKFCDAILNGGPSSSSSPKAANKSKNTRCAASTRLRRKYIKAILFAVSDTLLPLLYKSSTGGIQFSFGSTPAGGGRREKEDGKDGNGEEGEGDAEDGIYCTVRIPWSIVLGPAASGAIASGVQSSGSTMWEAVESALPSVGTWKGKAVDTAAGMLVVGDAVLGGSDSRPGRAMRGVVEACKATAMEDLVLGKLKGVTGLSESPKLVFEGPGDTMCEASAKFGVESVGIELAVRW